MTKQIEKEGINIESLCRSLGITEHGAKVSGGQFSNFRAGWSKPIMGEGDRVHYFERDLNDISRAKSLCGLSSKIRWLYGPGNYEYCRHCKARYKFRRDQ